MGKTDKNQAILQFDQRKSQTSAGERTVAGVSGGADMPSGEEPELRQILEAMQQSLTHIDRKRQLQDLRLEYRMLYQPRLRVMVDGKPLLSTEHKNLAQFMKRRMAKGRGCKTVDTLSQNGCD
ncbi:hypothetical protein NDU88_006782 [Pleurodeles waltl]|uniref:Uncharacterized protein n=1 Tax=Pleurodeles waltl TaxID=8319 RepID=A0AAV7X2N1_PLEWA|nr:hypothetical protein NDU88_006782 [Pleurodeles waltl]